MMKRQIQTCGGYNPDDGYSFTIAFGDGPAMTLDGLTKEDLQEIQSCVECLMLEEPELKIPGDYNAFP
jgi:hypothetical protein